MLSQNQKSLKGKHQMIGTSELEEIIKIALCTGKLKDERPLSLLIIATVGAGKTDLVSRYSEAYVDSVIYATDITSFALHKRHGKQLKSGKIRHIIIPDLLTPLNKQKEQANQFVTFMNGIIEEGIARIESKVSNFVVTVPIRCGLITTIAKQELDNRKDKWASLGFMSRMLPISYSYKKETVQEIFEQIFSRGYLLDNPTPLQLPPEQYVLLSEYLAKQIETYTIATKDANDEYGFRRQKQLQTFVMGRALLHGRNEVIEDDLDFLDEYAKYMGDKCTADI